jgi:hypothetical protein
MTSKLLVPLLVSLAMGCGGSSEPPLTNATSLMCPMPGDLPFRLMSTGYQNPASATLAMNDMRIKDEASDAIGNPSGAQANVYLEGSAMPGTGDIDYHGVKAITTNTDGIVGNALAGEFVSLWTYDAAGSDWMMLDRMKTDSNGVYDFPSTGYVAANGQPIYAMLEANGTCAEHFDYLLPSGTKVIVADIDGTLTLSNNEFFMEIADGTYVPKLMGHAAEMAQAWAAKKYQMIYLTARQHVYIPETRAWIESQGFPPGPIITENDDDTMPAPYKTTWLQRMITNFGWQVYAAYGNEDTDIQAYQAVSIPDANDFIVGPSGGDLGTTAIPNLDFAQHITDFIDMQPDNN